ncbi:hypothetical protein [Escherichia phage EP_H11]|nr:hypothetical protein [Escherichia phage EP_H11]
MEKVAALVEQIKNAANAYYNGDQPIITDEEFDALTEKLAELDPNNPLLTTPGWGVTEAAEHLAKCPHGSFVGGLDQVKIGAVEEGFNFLHGHEEVKGFVASAKLDGISVVLYYDYDGNFVRGLTRHDGVFGLDITKNLECAEFPRQIPKGIKEVRCEIVIPDDKFERISHEYSNQRNAASGIALAKYSDPALMELLDVVAYSVTAFYEDVDHETWMDDYNQLLLCLSKAGFKVVKYFVLPAGYVNSWLVANPPSKFREDPVCNYLLDGVVLGSMNVDWDENMLGKNTVHYKIKYQSAFYDTTVVKVHWVVSGYGRVVPTVEFETVDMSGVNVTYASGWNAEYIKNAGIGPGAKIKISRRNEVIPHIEEVVEPVTAVIPEFVDGVRTFWDGVHIRIKTKLDPMVIRTIIRDFAPKGLGGVNINKFAEQAKLDDISMLNDIIKTGPSHPVFGMVEMYDGPLQLTRQSFFNMKERPTSMDHMLTCTWTDGLGYATGMRIATAVTRDQMIRVLRNNSFHDMVNDGIQVNTEDYEICKAIYDACMGSVAKKIAENQEVILKVLNLPLNWVASKVEEPLPEGKFKICLTGKLSKPRSELVNSWIKYGVVEVGIGDAEYLVCDKPSQSSKFKAAEAKGTKIVTEDQFRKIIGAE